MMTEENINQNQQEELSQNNEQIPESAPIAEPISDPAPEPINEPISEQQPVPETSAPPTPEPIPEPESPRYVYHWDAGMEANKPQAKAEKQKSGTLPFVIMMASAFGIALLVLALVLIFLPGGEGTVGGTLEVTEIAEQCNPATVSIQVKTKDGGVSFGAGFIVTSDGHVITNHHVIDDAAADKDSILVKLYGDNTAYEAKLIGSKSSVDIAVLQIESKDGNAFSTFNIGNSTTVKAGERVVAIGSPEGISYGWTLTVGHVSHAERRIDNMNFIQFDAPVNPGNSGGPLINEYGQVVGVVTRKVAETVRSEVYDENGKVIGYTETLSWSDGGGLAIPINLVMETYESILAYQK